MVESFFVFFLGQQLGEVSTHECWWWRVEPPVHKICVRALLKEAVIKNPSRLYLISFMNPTSMIHTVSSRVQYNNCIVSYYGIVCVTTLYIGGEHLMVYRGFSSCTDVRTCHIYGCSILVCVMSCDKL